MLATFPGATAGWPTKLRSPFCSAGRQRHHCLPASQCLFACTQIEFGAGWPVDAPGILSTSFHQPNDGYTSPHSYSAGCRPADGWLLISIKEFRASVLINDDSRKIGKSLEVFAGNQKKATVPSNGYPRLANNLLPDHLIVSRVFPIGTPPSRRTSLPNMGVHSCWVGPPKRRSP